jgi:hypothetical protein
VTLIKLMQSLKWTKACEIDGLPSECVKHLPRSPLVHLAKLINLSHFPETWKEAKNDSLAKTKLRILNSTKICPISLLSNTSKLLKNCILKIIQRHTDGRNFPNASQFGFHANRSTKLQCMRLRPPCNSYYQP